MATMGFQLAYGNPHIVHLPEHATDGSFKAGDLVSIVGGCIQLAAGPQAIFGVAQKASTGTDYTSTPVHVISPEDIFLCECDTDLTTAQVGTSFGANVGTAGSMSVAASSTGTLVIIDFHDPVGTPLGKVLVKFIPAVLQGSAGTTATA